MEEKAAGPPQRWRGPCQPGRCSQPGGRGPARGAGSAPAAAGGGGGSPGWRLALAVCTWAQRGGAACPEAHGPRGAGLERGGHLSSLSQAWDEVTRDEPGQCPWSASGRPGDLMVLGSGGGGVRRVGPGWKPGAPWALCSGQSAVTASPGEGTWCWLWGTQEGRRLSSPPRPLAPGPNVTTSWAPVTLLSFLPRDV